MGHFADFFIEGTQLVGTKSPGDQGKLFGLFDQGSQDAWMAMALIEGGVRCQHIQILIAFHVPDPGPGPGPKLYPRARSCEPQTRSQGQ